MIVLNMHWRHQAVEDVAAGETYLGLRDIFCMYLINQLISKSANQHFRKHQKTISIQVVDVGKAFIAALGALINVKFLSCFLLLQQKSFSSIEITFKQYEPIELIF